MDRSLANWCWRRCAYRFATGRRNPRRLLQAYRAKWAGKLRGKIVLLSQPKVPAPQTNPQFRRYTAAELADMAIAPSPATKFSAKKLDDLEWPEDPAEIGKFFGSLPNALMEQLYDLYDQAVADRGEFFAKEGVVGVHSGRRARARRHALQRGGRRLQGSQHAGAAHVRRDRRTVQPDRPAGGKEESPRASA